MSPKPPRPGPKLEYRVVSRPQCHSGDSKTGLYVTCEDVEGWLHDMLLQGWEFVSYGSVQWRTEGRMDDSFWIFKRVHT